MNFFCFYFIQRAHTRIRFEDTVLILKKKTLKVFFLSNIMNLYFVYYDLIINNLALILFWEGLSEAWENLKCSHGMKH